MLKRKKYSKEITSRRFDAVVIGVSAGGINALSKLVACFPPTFCLPVFIVQHISPKSDNYLVDILQKVSTLKIKEADEKEGITGGVVYIAPANYHLLIENNRTLALSTEERISFARPSVDVLFESAAYVYASKLIGVILTGANKDGALGMKMIKELGGTTIVQNPATAEVNSMPIAAIQATDIDYILDLDEIGPKIIEISC